MSSALKRALPLIISVLIGVLGAVGLVVVVDDNGDGRPDAIKVPIPGAVDVIADADGELDAAEQAEAGDPIAERQGPDVHEDLSDEVPAGVNGDEASLGLSQTFAPGLQAPQATGGAQRVSCDWRPVVNFSSRGGARPLIAVLHYTVSPNRPGTADLEVIRRLFNTPSFQASSNYLIDFEGNCWQLVREADKAWTQGNFNPRSISVEIIATGSESTTEWKASALIRRGILAALWRDVLKRNGLPLRFTNPVGCVVGRAGWTDHNSLECGNTHHDVQPAFPYRLFSKQLRGDVCGDRCKLKRRLRTRHERIHRKLREDPRCDVKTACEVIRTNNRRVHKRANRAHVDLSP